MWKGSQSGWRIGHGDPKWIHFHRTGQTYQKEAKLEIFKRSFSRTGAIIWNQISSNWRDASKPIFKKIIRRFLFETLSDRDDYVEVDTLTQILKSKD